MAVPTCSADGRSIPAFPLSEVRKVTHLMWVNPRLAILRKPITVASLTLCRKDQSRSLKLGVGESTRVKVKLRDQTKIEGYISDVGAETFSVTNRKTGGLPSGKNQMPRWRNTHSIKSQIIDRWRQD